MAYPRSETIPFHPDQFQRYPNFERGLSNYAANNTTAMAAPFELNPDDIARLDDDITTHAFREDFLRQPTPYTQRYSEAKENYYQPRSDKGMDEIGRLAAAIGNGPLSSEMDHSPLGMRRNTDEVAARKVLTPPTSSSPQDYEKPFRRPLGNLSNIQPPRFDEKQTRDHHHDNVWKAERDGALIEMQNLYEQRIETLKKAEQEKIASIEAEYKAKIEKLQRDMAYIMEKQENVMKLKGDVELRDVNKYKEAYRREHEARKADRSKYEERIKDLTGRIDELQRKLKKYSNGFADKDKSALIRGYDQRLADIQEESDRKIADLIKQFEREKHSALEIMKTKIKSEVNLLVPRIKQQCQDAFGKALTKCQEQTALKYKEKYSEIIRKLKEEHQAENRFIAKQAKDQADQEKQEWQRKMKSRYEMKALEVKNECEKKLIGRMRNGRSRPNNVSFVSDLTVLSDDRSLFEDSFLF